jgi:hypothetical protein
MRSYAQKNKGDSGFQKLLLITLSPHCDVPLMAFFALIAYAPHRNTLIIQKLATSCQPEFFFCIVSSKSNGETACGARCQ